VFKNVVYIMQHYVPVGLVINMRLQRWSIQGVPKT